MSVSSRRFSSVVVVLILSMAFSCKGSGPSPIADGKWRALPIHAQVVAAGGLPAGGIWFAAEYRSVVRVDAEGRSRAQSLPVAHVDGAATPSGDLWLASVGKEARMMRVAADGSITADRSVPIQVSAQTYDLAVIDGGAVAIGVHNPPASGLTQAWLLGVKDDGSVLFEHRLGVSGFGYLAAVTSLGGGLVAAVGRIDGREELVIAGIDGSVSRHGPLLGPGRMHVGDVAPLDGDIVVLGFSIDRETVGSFEGQIAVERRGPDGAVRWTRRGEVDVSHISEAIAVDGEVLALASTKSDPSGKLLLVRVRGDGTISTSEIDGPAMSSPIDIAAFLTIGPDGSPKLLQVDGLKKYPRESDRGKKPRYRLMSLASDGE